MAGAIEPDEYTFTWTGAHGANKATAGIMRYSGAHPVNPINASGAQSGTSASPIAPGVTTTVINTSVLRLAAIEDGEFEEFIDGVSSPYPPGVLGLFVIEAPGSNPSMAAADIPQASAGSTFDAAFDVTAEQLWRAVTIAIQPVGATLIVTVDGSGFGTVTSTPAGIDCPEDCIENYDFGDKVALTAVADVGSTFTGWTGGGTDDDPRLFTMDDDRAVTATFTIVDTTSPVVTITTPADGATFELNAVVPADYACSDAGSGIASCIGDVSDGAAIDTASLGAKTFTVTGTDNEANVTVAVNGYTVVDTTSPVVTITTPADESTFELNAVVPADYACSDAGSGIASCIGDVADGAAIDTASLGAKTFTVTGTDNAANVTVAVNGYTVVDTTSPVVTITSPADGATFELNAVVPADYACSDAGSGIASCIGDVADGAAIDTASLGAKTFTVTGTDNAANVTVAVNGYTVVADTTDPLVTITTPADGSTFELNAVVPADYACSDAGSGIASCIGDVADGVAIDTASLGAKTFTVTGTDNAANVTVAVNGYTVVANTESPTVTITTPADGSTFELNTVMPADYACSDAGSGIASCIGDVADGAAIDTAGLGDKSFTVTGTDNAGNDTVVVNAYTVVATTEPPTVTITTPADGATFGMNAVVPADYACSDAGSGIASCIGDVADGAAIDTAGLGDKSFTVTGTDNAGNDTVVVNAYTVVATTEPPTVTITTPADGATFEMNAVVPADYACSDAGSGIASCIGDVADGAAIDTASLGAKSFTVTGTDNAGNDTVVVNSYTVVEATDPVVTITTPANGSTFELNAVVPADYACSDAGSGIASCIGDVADGAAIDTAGLGDKSFTVTGTDNAGNDTVVVNAYTVVATTEPPTVTITTPADGATFEMNAVVPADYACSDAGSGIASCIGDVANGAAIDTAGLGDKSFTVTGTDNAGNDTVVVNAYTVVATTEPPTVTITTPADGATFEMNAVVPADYACSDAGSGIASCIGDVADGAAIDTASLGAKTFTVTGTDNAANVTVAVNGYTVVEPPAPPPVNASPTAQINSPAWYAGFLTGDSISFNGSGDDSEDGNLLGLSLVWRSNVDGQIGTGESFTTTLSLGNHTITLEATDSKSATGMAVRDISVSDPPEPPVVPTPTPAPEPTATPTPEPTATGGGGRANRNTRACANRNTGACTNRNARACFGSSSRSGSNPGAPWAGTDAGPGGPTNTWGRWRRSRTPGGRNRWYHFGRDRGLGGSHLLRREEAQRTVHLKSTAVPTELG